MASDLDDSDGSDDSLHRTKIIKSAFDSDSFDSDGTIHVDGLVGSATISPSGRDIALASPDGLAIIDLDSPYNAPRRVKSHGMPWLVVDVQWSPFAARDYWVASTANHCCLVWNLNRPDDSSSGAVEHSLRGHRRSITDINFSAHHPDMLATCSVDGYVHCWDLRRPSTPALTFIDWVAGATQVKYNRQDDHVIASSHNRCVHIWDDRKASLPLRTIEAHNSKIYGLDWNRTNSSSLVTCSLDKTIKFWDYTVRGSTGGASTLAAGGGGSSVRGMGTVGPINEDDVPERVIQTNFPIWRARHTPFGGGLLAMPQNAPGNLYLYDARPSAVLAAEDPASANDPVAVFPGHGHHKVKEFLWRSRGGIEDGLDNRDFQLVSWGDDNKLRLSRLDSGDLGTVGYQRGRPAPKNLNVTRKGASYKTFRVLEDLGDYEKRSATMSSLRPVSHRGTVSLPASQGVSRRPSPTPEDDDHHNHHHHHHHHHHHGHNHSHSHHHNHLHKHSQTRHHSHQHPPQAPTKGSSPSLPPPRSLSSSNINSMKSPTLTPQRGKYEQRPSWRNPSMRATQVSGRNNPDQSNVQLDWMKGVTMNKRKTSTEPALTSSQEQLSEPTNPDAQRKVSTDSALSSPLQMSTHDASISMSSDVNNEPESIQEEIVRITAKLPRVKWEELDMDNLVLVASMKGPWGVDGQVVFIKVKVTVPASYPTARSPRFYIENSSLVPEATQEKIAADLFMLTAEYLKRRRNCLLIAFRYLLGEVNLDNSIALLNRALTNPRLANDESGESSSSSDSEDDVESASAAFMSPIEAIGSEVMIGPTLPLPPPPPPRSCGAVFTRDGRIVTFFLTKVGKASAKIMFEKPSPPTRDELAELEQPVFIGFGKVLPSRIGGSSRRRPKGVEWYNDSSSSDESDSSTYSDGSSSSSSSSSSGNSSGSYHHYSPNNLMDPWSTNMGFQRRIVRGGKSDRKRRPSDFDDNDSDSLIRSGTLDPGLPVGPKSTVSIEDMRPYLPSKRDLARDYAIFGDGAEVCEHNARVAEKYGESDLANIWRYAALILKSDVPLRLASMYDDAGQRKKSILVIAREAVADANNKDADNGDNDNDTAQSPLTQIQKQRTRDHLSGRVKWGLHPLARDFVDDLFDYFERLADVQMLAMLSCIFGESFEEDSVAYAESHLSKSDTPLPMKAPSFSLDYLPTIRGHLSAAPPPLLVLSGTSTPGGGGGAYGSGSNNSSMPPTPGAVVYDGSIDPDNDFDDEFDDYDYDTGMWGDGTHENNNNGLSQNNSYSGGETPPKWLVGSAPNGGSGNGSGVLSSSPSFGVAAGRFLRRGNNAVVSAIAAGIPQTLTTLLSSSPNDRSGGSPIGVLTPPAMSRRQSFFDSAPPSQRQSPQARYSYLGANFHAGQARLPHHRQQQQQQQDQLVLHSTSAHRDIPFPTSVSQRLLGVSASTSPRNTSGLGKLSSLSSSPQDQAPIRKRPSPAETIFSNLTAGNLTWAASALFGGGRDGGSGGGGSGGAGNGSAGPSTEPGTAATSVSDEGRRREQAIAAAAANAIAKGAKTQAEAAASNMVAVDVLVRTYNDHLFDDDGWMVASLLGGKRRRRLYAEYRYAYSELLQVWNEPLARLEVLKFNVLREDAMKAAAVRNGDESSTTGAEGANTTTDDAASLPSGSLGINAKHDRLVAMRNSGRGLDAVGICEHCELQLEPLEYDARASLTVPAVVGSKLGGAVGICRRCRRARSQLRCVYCTEPVDAIYMPCFGCGCASHPRCLRAWYDAGERLCPAGDECACTEEATAGRIESWTAMQAQLAMAGIGGAGGSRSRESSSNTPSPGSQPIVAEPVSTKSSRGLIAQARRSAHYASSSSSAVLVSPYGQHYHAEGEGAASPRSSTPKGAKGSARASNMRNVSKSSSSVGYYDDPNDIFGSTLGQGAESRGSATTTTNTPPPVITTTNNTGGGGFWGTGRRAKQASSGLRQQLQQQQMEHKQKDGGTPGTGGGAAAAGQRQTSMQHDARQSRRVRSQEQQQQQQQQESSSPHTPEQPSSQDGSQGSSSGASGGGSPAASSTSGASGGHLSAARLSLSSRLLRGSALRRQAAPTTPASSAAGDANNSNAGSEANDSPHMSQ